MSSHQPESRVPAGGSPAQPTPENVTIALDALPHPVNVVTMQGFRLLPTTAPTCWHLYFGQLVGDRRVLGAVVIEVSQQSLRQLVKSCYEKPAFLDALAESGATETHAFELSDDETTVLPPAQIPVLSGEILRLTRAGTRGSLDVYDSSPRALHEATTMGAQLRVAEVMSIRMDSSCLLTFVRAVERLVSSWPRE